MNLNIGDLYSKTVDQHQSLDPTDQQHMPNRRIPTLHYTPCQIMEAYEKVEERKSGWFLAIVSAVFSPQCITLRSLLPPPVSPITQTAIDHSGRVQGSTTS
ncbi:hypothetical protein AVEN_21884-1 [Araneus ventricosus]|uniref:Uncharacterized protein n=1 Tax=Araneus ventricosus TaxID=182803 RepID=A0A4Y2SJW3_ARAVE|nr:hypothetical protein AVEN_68149-1 [Araneus ventricosus]GBN88427.1 hypothetical protein AVEN_21884-1 [Araneus ventricosus]